ncbi:ABC transporter substrate-binding protein [Haloarcula salina]|uniref:ABC transporter substrate-binding protein n=1 Tax=Haloarcula salina TaxID=1429914 RepID=A0AA41G337_9EURY|nr:ABC transporter substrate-binding protein [Haloarcula salina]MBV0902641.1 ABC transporter substrate-binding protein [Haloarcula salina]
MPDDSSGHEVPTRRDFVRYGGAVVGGGLLAGCAGQSDSGSTSTETTGGEIETATPLSEDESYAVTMSPVGTVEFEQVPENILPYFPISAGTTVALGHGESINAIGYDKELFGNTVDYYYDRLESVSFEWEELARVTQSDTPNSIDEEVLYELDSDVHFLDPAVLRSSNYGWDQADIEAIASDVGPWFGNYYSRTNGQPPASYRESYEYYSLWEYIGKIASVLRETERYRAFKSIRDDLVSRILSRLPPEPERPSVAIVAYANETFWPYDFTQDGYIWGHVRPMGVENAFETVQGGPGSDGSYDIEGIAEASPDVILRYWGTALGETFVERRAKLLDRPLAEEIPALDDERYYPSGHGMQGPVMNLFNLEMTAKQLYPEQFGEWPAYTEESYPEIPDGEQLFDRQRVAAIINGDI